jgi:hypothetical protein
MNEIKIKIDDKEIEIVSEMKYLGVYIDNILNFNKNTYLKKSQESMVYCAALISN